MLSRQARLIDHSASAMLRSLAANATGAVPFASIAEAAGARVHGLALLLLVLPETLPLPLPSISVVLALPLLVISVHLTLFGEGSGWPARLERVAVPRTVLAAMAEYLAPILERLEDASRPRWRGLARRERLVGFVAIYLSAILFLPIPFMNAAPALCLAAIALGLIQRDGLLIAIGFAGTAVISGMLAWLGIWAASIL